MTTEVQELELGEFVVVTRDEEDHIIDVQPCDIGDSLAEWVEGVFS